MRAPTNNTLLAAALAAVACLALSACGAAARPAGSGRAHAGHASAKQATQKPQSGHATIAIRDFMYHPMDLTVTPGTKVTFHNYDHTAHTASAINGGFDTGTIKPGASVTVVLHKPGTYRYHCLFHQFMVARVVVVRRGSSG